MKKNPPIKNDLAHIDYTTSSGKLYRFKSWGGGCGESIFFEGKCERGTVRTVRRLFVSLVPAVSTSYRDRESAERPAIVPTTPAMAGPEINGTADAPLSCFQMIPLSDACRLVR